MDPEHTVNAKAGTQSAHAYWQKTKSYLALKVTVLIKSLSVLQGFWFSTGKSASQL